MCVRVGTKTHNYTNTKNDLLFFSSDAHKSYSYIFIETYETMFDKSRNWTCVQYYHKLQCACGAKFSSAFRAQTHRQTHKQRCCKTHHSLTRSFSYFTWFTQIVFPCRMGARSAASPMCNVYSYVFGCGWLRAPCSHAGVGAGILNIHLTNTINQRRSTGAKITTSNTI